MRKHFVLIVPVLYVTVISLKAIIKPSFSTFVRCLYEPDTGYVTTGELELGLGLLLYQKGAGVGVLY